MTIHLPTILPGATPTFHRGNKIGCLVLHGFMASPAEVGWLGDHLAGQGYTVYVPRLPGHSIDPAHMKRVRWQDWYAHALDGYHILQQQCEQVFVIGHSMGGLLASLLATAAPVRGLVVAASPLTINNWQLRWAREFSVFLPYTDQPTSDDLQAIIRAEQVRRGKPEIGRVHYRKWASRALYEMYLLMKLTRTALPKIDVPILLLYALQDTTSPLSDQHLFADNVSSQIIEQHILEDGGHIIFQDTGRDEAFRIVADFMAGLIDNK